MVRRSGGAETTDPAEDPMMATHRELALEAKAWPFQQARELLKRVEAETEPKECVLFETGYGPSGLPHIGTFAEVVRTTMVRRAFAEISDVPTRLIAFSDDMDGMRKVPDNVPNAAMLSEHLEKPLTSVPDPFGTHESFGHHNNARLRTFLDRFDFEYEFVSSTECYRSGRFDQALLRVLECFENIRKVILPTLGEERQKTYSPFLPVCPRTGRVLQVPVEPRPADGTVVYRDDDGKSVEVPVTGGHCKLQWKADWGMRWYALGVDYEMSGKDLIESFQLSSKICNILGRRPPMGFTYELFLDEEAKKISKSKGNGLTVDEWLQYAPDESLSYFMFQSPRKAKRLYFDVIPKCVDEYMQHRAKFPTQEPDKRLENPVWHIDVESTDTESLPVGYGMLLNLVGVAHAENPDVLWGFITQYQPDATPESAPTLDRLVRCAIRYYDDFIRPTLEFRDPDTMERAALEDLVRTLRELPDGVDAEGIQTQVYEVGKRHEFPDLRSWFKTMYEVLLGRSQGPRMGSFIALYGIDRTIERIEQALAGELTARSAST
jgi:lysyl-tRNA synthetase class 1